MRTINKLMEQLNKSENHLISSTNASKEIYIDFKKSKNIDFEDIYFIIRIIQVATKQNLFITIRNFSQKIKTIIEQKTDISIAEFLDKKNEHKTIL